MTSLEIERCLIAEIVCVKEPVTATTLPKGPFAWMRHPLSVCGGSNLFVKMYIIHYTVPFTGLDKLGLSFDAILNLRACACVHYPLLEGPPYFFPPLTTTLLRVV